MTTAAITIRGLEKTYPNGMRALKGLDLDVGQGDFFALLGPNGAGKSTTIGILSSLVNKSAGKVSIFGHDLDTDLIAAKRCIGVVPQEFNFSQFEKVQDILVNQAGYYGIPAGEARERAEHFLRRLSLWDKRDVPTRMLSGGMKRRLMIARALIHEPRLLILDEPTAGVDIEIRRSMWQFLEEINAQGVTIVLTTHYLEEAEQLCRNIAIIDGGQIIHNTSMRKLLKQLHVETFLLDCRDAMEQAPALPGFPCVLADDHTLEVQVDKEQGMNSLFVELAAQGIEVLSLRNKSNRLEELFLGVVEGNNDKGAA
ncbi:ABC transporter ATP-binding protein [Pseudomonas sp. G11-1]|uniref:ABC-2 type transport system ATP-binding protein n=1 Tax=Halopseudomonas bauzanensis TaxID=653930 RepID=A0A031MB90_9GAMM|nr:MULTISPECIES: ABC transporter ATP-binding protein [Halopseudomonas]MCO5786187.1 ABC transporter ATP-binding protein [Pseudomonas sp. G11-1]MCO5789413.1 ABC transporter ATP-binding protein [Pseudomonas sp. G11-2]EZQ17265.1 ABC transporter [Halopseudomonas bauzanensis]WGK62883.1 ABC transporter ATP-binding protein [Halopseudomonas sp. SMJS2]SES13535.1 ABC-2 type transport system ATP-binding protein [Halopseudomonas bauzanensis]